MPLDSINGARFNLVILSKFDLGGDDKGCGRPDTKGITCTTPGCSTCSCGTSKNAGMSFIGGRGVVLLSLSAMVTLVLFAVV